jgi:hypothetical protein
MSRIRPAKHQTQNTKHDLTKTPTPEALERIMAKADKQLTLKPLDDRVVVQPLDAEEKTSGGILLPDNAKQKPQQGTEVNGKEYKILRESEILGKVTK